MELIIFILVMALVIMTLFVSIGYVLFNPKIYSPSKDKIVEFETKRNPNFVWKDFKLL